MKQQQGTEKQQLLHMQQQEHYKGKEELKRRVQNTQQLWQSAEKEKEIDQVTYTVENTTKKERCCEQCKLCQAECNFPEALRPLF